MKKIKERNGLVLKIRLEDTIEFGKQKPDTLNVNLCKKAEVHLAVMPRL